ncbi:MAG: hypothetical protein AAF993_22340, partial [Pseudomonadota bacterium]
QNCHARVLTIAVVNTPDNCPPEAYQRTVALCAALQRRPDTLVLDLARRPYQLPASKAVGLARKIGSDVALGLIAAGQIQSPWIYQTDGDAVLPENYFSSTLPANGAAVFAHHHVSADNLAQRAADLYDLHMRYYVGGLAYAGSKYAHPSLGSTISIHAQTYAEIHGYPQRNAGEDFYLLNKACKVAPVTYIPEVNVRLRARLSRRVPFGTGPALQKIIEQLRDCPDGSTYCSYHPESFAVLKTALRATAAHWAGADIPAGLAARTLDQLGYADFAAGVHRQSAPPAQRQLMLTQWFDGFRQLRFVHLLRDHYPDQSLLHSLETAPFQPAAAPASTSPITA